jgi:hypothetical protein
MRSESDAIALDAAFHGTRGRSYILPVLRHCAESSWLHFALSITVESLQNRISKTDKLFQRSSLVYQLIIIISISNIIIITIIIVRAYTVYIFE